MNRAKNSPTLLCDHQYNLISVEEDDEDINNKYDPMIRKLTISSVIRMIFRPKSRVTCLRLTCAFLSVACILLLLQKKSNSLHHGHDELHEGADSLNSINVDADHLLANDGSIIYTHRRHQQSSNHPDVEEPLLSATDIGRYHELNPVIDGWGSNGDPVYLKTESEELEATKLFKSGAFNVYISDRISPNRSLTDPRPSECSAIKYLPSNDLGTTSVIIIYTDEIWSALIRTIWSVWNRTPDHLLKEIILVDDDSSKPELKSDLDKYVNHYFGDRVTILRTPKREGLIRARIMGAKIAKGDVLLFLDSHCEVTTSWLEPLMKLIKEDKRNVVCPVIDVISDKTLEYSVGNPYYFQVGGFTWSGHFTWIDIPEDYTKNHPTSPVESPTMAGGLFAINKEYFFQLGSYDEQMEIWGGENLELSFRVWTCGGRLLIHPCSHVGHIFRDYHPYSFQGKDTHGINTLRTILVWMDHEYQKYFFMYRNDLKNKRPGDLSQRFKLKEQLSCKSFHWYLNHVFKGKKFIYDRNVTAYGYFENPASGLCLDILNRDEEKSNPLGLYSCTTRDEESYTNQVFSLMRSGEIRREETCASIKQRKSATNRSYGVVQMAKCIDVDLASEENLIRTKREKKRQQWTHLGPDEWIKNVGTKECLSTKGAASGDDVVLSKCDSEDPNQKWIAQKYV